MANSTMLLTKVIFKHGELGVFKSQSLLSSAALHY